MNPLLPVALLMGAAGSAHCIGMCGPIALAVPSIGPSRTQRWLSALLLNGGRLTTYVVLGVLFGAFGQGLRLAGLQRGTSLLAGALLLLAVILPGSLARLGVQGRLALWLARLRGRLAQLLKRTAPEAVFLSGALNGLLPCGLVYAASLGAAGMESALGGAFFMLLFGLGTWPALIALRLSGAVIGPALRSVVRKSAPAMMAAMAVLLIVRGLGLDIPYFSPAVPDTPLTVTACH